MDAMTDAASLWRNRNYNYYRLSRAVSMLGSRMTTLAAPLLVLSMGGGAVQAGALGSAWFVAQIAFQLPAGHLADRFDQRQLMLAMDLVRLIAIGSIPIAAVLEVLTFPHLLAVVLVEGAASVVFGSASMVFIGAIVPASQFSRAMSQFHFAAGVISVIGPILGGALYSVDRLLPFVVDAASYVISGVLLFLVSVRARKTATDEQADRRVTAGIRWLWRRADIMRPVLFCTALNLVGAAMGVAALVVLTQQGAQANIVGIVMGWSGAGVILGSLVATRAITLGPWLYPIAGVLWAGSLTAIAVSPSPWTVGVVLTFLAFLGPSTGVMLFQTLRDEAPGDMYGRVIAAQQLMSTSLAAVAPLVTGVVVAVLGGAAIWVVLAAICLGATTLTIPRRRMARETAGDAVAPGEPAVAVKGLG
jgi:MFS family permease